MKFLVKVMMMSAIWRCPSFEDASDDEAVQSPLYGELLDIRRIMNVQTKMEDDVQCENIFHIRCKISYVV